MPTLSISSEKVCYLIVKLREFDVADVETDPDDGSNPADDRMVSVLEDHADNPTAQEIAEAIADLIDDQRADLLGLLRLGRGDGGTDEWEALSQLGVSCADFEMDRL